MASLTFARPGKVSERQYLGDLACLFDRQRQRSGLALTMPSFASDLAASDSLRSALFTLCTAISRMGENDLSPEELLGLVARALNGAASAQGETSGPVPAEMREAFLSGYAQWQDRGLQSAFGESDDWLSDRVIPFPGRRIKTAEEQDNGLRSDASIAEAYYRRRHTPSALSEDNSMADDRPAGIDALLAAAPAWARTTPPARSFDEEAFLSRNVSVGPPQLAELISVPMDTGANSAEAKAVAVTPTAAPHSRLEAEDIPPLSPLERLQAFLMRLPPRKVFFALAGLTILAGAFAGVMAYRTLHTGQVLQFKDLEPSVAFAASPGTSAPTTQFVAPVGLGSTASIAVPVIATPQTPLATRPTVTVSLRPAALDLSTAAASQSAPSVLDIPAPTMIGYALATPQPTPLHHAPTHADGETVAVDIVISRLGDVISAEPVSGPQQFFAASVRAVRGWRFRPYLVDGRPVEVATTLQFAF